MKKEHPIDISFPHLNPNPVIELSFAGKVIYANPAARQVLEQSGMGQDYAVFLPTSAEKMAQELSQGETNTLFREVTIEDKIFAVSVSPIPGTDTLRIYAIDVTEHKQADKRLGTILRTAPIGIGIVINRVITEVNDLLCQMIGYTKEELVGHSSRILYPTDEDFNFVGQEKYRQITDKGVGSVETRWQCKDGRIITILLSSAPIEPKDIAQGVTFTAMDITERKREEEARRKSEERFRIAQELSPDGFTILHPTRDESGEITDFTWLYENQTIARLNGTDPKQVVGRPISELLPEHTSTPFHRLYKRVADTGQPEVMECPYHGDTISKPKWLRVAVVPMNEDIAILAQDISESKQMEEELRRSKDELEMRVQERTKEVTAAAEALEAERQHFHEVLDALPVYVALLTPDYKVRFANKVFLDRFGDAQGLKCFEHLFQRTNPCEDCQTYNVFNTMKPNEWEWKGPDGRIYSVFDFPFNDTDGSGLILEMGIDITERKEAENERERLEEQLRQSHKMEAIGTLAGGIAHDFNNMLAVIMGNAELALDDIEEEGPSANLKQILKASKRSRDLVTQILTFSTKKGEDLKALHLAPLLQETYDLLRAAIPSTIETQLEIHTNDDVILANSSQIQQIILNLANNATYAMRNSGGTLTIALTSITLGPDSFLAEETKSHGRYVKLTIKDTGEGISPEVQQRIFEPFFTTKEKSQNAGMGLSVVYGIVNAHHGSIEIESEMGKGSTFTVIIPQSNRPTGAEQKRDDSPASLKERILFVDDEPDLAEMTRLMLEKLGCQVTACTDSSEALDIFARDPNRFTLVITDYTMPGITGLALAEQILEIRKDIPIILCTGYSDAISPDIAKRTGIREFIMKPVTRAQMAQAIQRAVLAI